MTVTTRAAMYNSGDRTGLNAMDTFIQKEAIAVFNKQKLFGQPDMCHYKALPAGNTFYQFSITEEPSLTTSNSALVEGQTPTSDAQNYESVVVDATEYGQVKVLTNRTLKQSPIDVYSDTARTIGEGLARVRDFAIQESINDGDNLLYSAAGTASTTGSRAALTATDVFSNSIISNTRARLQANGAEEIMINGQSAYGCIIHPNVAHDLNLDATVTYPTRGSVAKSGDAKGADYFRKGYLGMIFGVHVLVSNNLLAFEGAGAGGIDVYPCYLFGKDAYGVVEDEMLQIMRTPVGQPTDSDPLGQRSKVSGRFSLGADILKQDAMYRVEVGSSI